MGPRGGVYMMANRKPIHLSTVQTQSSRLQAVTIMPEMFQLPYAMESNQFLLRDG
jgi:hypothetical protein